MAPTENSKPPCLCHTSGSATALFGLFGIVIIVFVVLYTVGLSILGGILGWYLLEETDSK